MFDPTTAQLLRAAPEVPGLRPSDIPALLTKHYATLVSERLRGNSDGSEADIALRDWPLEKIADTYELIVSLEEDPEKRRAAAFVAGTAHQIMTRRSPDAPVDEIDVEGVNRDRVDPAISASILFLIAEQYADAHEASQSIVTQRKNQSYESQILSEGIVNLARGDLQPIIDRSARWRRPREGLTLEDRALAALVETIITGVELLAARILDEPISDPISTRFESPDQAFSRVASLSTLVTESPFDMGDSFLRTYPGPYHLASLLQALDRNLQGASLCDIPPPGGANGDFWRRWIKHRAKSFPYVWPNHRVAVAQSFHESGRSAVVVLPTGAGKTTLSSLKIAATLAQGKKVIFLAPTHALAEQLTSDLQQIFPKEIIGSTVSLDFDSFVNFDLSAQEIEIMTPERCLATLTFSPETFEDAGLLVFDECHLLSPESGKIRRALDAMLCILAYCSTNQTSDLLFLSAMLRNGTEFGKWIEKLTGRECITVDLLWKPSRQARGVVVYDRHELTNVVNAAVDIQNAEDARKRKRSKSLRAAAERKLNVRPWAVWGLQHNWLRGAEPQNAVLPISDVKVRLTGTLDKRRRLWPTPNANVVASQIAAAAAKSSGKTIVFVNTKDSAIKAASEISAVLPDLAEPTDSEKIKWSALEIELGSLRHSMLNPRSAAIPHNSAMFFLERDLVSSIFKRPDGASVVVATPTLAQGLNFPAYFAILAGDTRSDADGRENLKAHEILNAAARAGRAGHLANGVVLLVPDPVIEFTEGAPLSSDAKAKLRSVVPEDDRCVTVTDPIQKMLDRIMSGDERDVDLRYFLNRMALMPGSSEGDATPQLFDIRKSLAAFLAEKQNRVRDFEQGVTHLAESLRAAKLEGMDAEIEKLASNAGLPAILISKLRERLFSQIGALPTTVADWLSWLIVWLSSDEEARLELLGGTARSIRAACGLAKDGEISPVELKHITPGLLCWINGGTVGEIERALGGDPDSEKDSLRICPRARELINSVIPRGMSFAMSLAAYVVEQIAPYEQQANLSQDLVTVLGTAVRRGYNCPDLVLFANVRPAVKSRVQIHAMWKEHTA